ncbi:hypothetical protein M0805_003025 [Coniferiporia weirii]|nr:hypothetical protein M0805_003025 [Coniferiporia weirii]
MPFDPVRDAVLNSPISQTHALPLPSPHAPLVPTPAAMLSSPTSYFAHNHPANSSGGASTSLGGAGQSPLSSRRATDLSVLLNADDRIPSPTYQRRPGSSGSAVASPSFGTPRPRSAHLSHILQPTSEDDQSLVQPPLVAASPLSSPLQRARDILQPSFSRSRVGVSVLQTIPPSSRHLGSDRRTSSSSASGSMSVPRSPEMPSRASSVLTDSLPQKPIVSHPTRSSTIPYAPRNRRTAPTSVLAPLPEAEREFYKTLNKNPLRAHKLGKRKLDDVSNDSFSAKNIGEAAAKRSRDVGLVVQHYNQRPDVGVTQRQQSPIIGLKNFNNWVKSVIIARFAHPVLRGDEGVDEKRGKGGSNGKFQFSGAGGKVLDMGCGKGGDLNKWQKARVRDYVGVDIAAVSIEQARSRYLSSAAGTHSSKVASRYNAFFAALDCYSDPLNKNPDMPLPPQAAPFDIVSMQFCMHYAFESERKARVMLENVTRYLRKGGRFIGTIPNDRLLLQRLDAIPPDRDPSDLSFGNAVYRIKFDNRNRSSMFGIRYSFFLQDAVEDVPEYIVQWDNFIQLAADYHLRLLYKAEFHDVYAEHCEHPEFGPLLQRMKVVDSSGESQMDEDQWEAANVYIAFAFEKI